MAGGQNVELMYLTVLFLETSILVFQPNRTLQNWAATLFILTVVGQDLEYQISVQEIRQISAYWRVI